MTAPIQWYPGHIGKLDRELEKHLTLADVVIEIVDARIPNATRHKSLSERVMAKWPVLIIMSKADLADPNRTKQWLDHFKKDYPQAMAFDSTTGKGKKDIASILLKLGEPVFQKLQNKGLKRRPLRVAVVGMPNVGKSSLINSLVGKKKVRTGHRAGVTQQTQWVRIHPEIELLDTPGLIPPQLDSPQRGLHLAWVYSVGDKAFEEEQVAPEFLSRVDEVYPDSLRKIFDIEAGVEVTLESIALRRGYLQSGGRPDLKRTAQAILKDFRHGKLGRLTLESPQES